MHIYRDKHTHTHTKLAVVDYVITHLCQHPDFPTNVHRIQGSHSTDPNILISACLKATQKTTGIIVLKIDVSFQFKEG